MVKISALCSACAFVLHISSAFATPPLQVGRPQTIGVDQHVARGAVPARVTLFDQNNDRNAGAILSSNFTSGSFSSYDSYAADDFVVPFGHKWEIKEVDVTGTFDGYAGGASSEEVIFYKGTARNLETIVSECSIAGISGYGSFILKIPSGCKVNLTGGRSGAGKRYWISVVANVDEIASEPWYWQTRNHKNGKLAVWENPADGLRTGCKTWEVLEDCTGNNNQGLDFMFALKGNDIAY